jgi:hypothetical protein
MLQLGLEWSRCIRRRAASKETAMKLSFAERLRLWDATTILRVAGVCLVSLPAAILFAFLDPCTGAGSGKEYNIGLETKRFFAAHVREVIGQVSHTTLILVLAGMALGVVLLVISRFTPE